MELKNIHQSKTVRGVLMGLFVAVVLLVVFQAGQVSGYHKARFAGSFGNNFEKNFMGPKGGGMKMFFNGDVPGGHGAVGEIVSLQAPSFVVAGPDGFEKTVMTGTSTQVKRFKDSVEVSDLKIGEFVVVLGSPNDGGYVDAHLVRVMPKPEYRFNGKHSR